MKISIAADHGGYELKQALIQSLDRYSFMDLGTDSLESVHYPNFADLVCKSILNKESDLGILICGTGIGISMRANRFFGIRAALVHDVHSATMAKAHNNANVLCLGGRSTPLDDAILFINTWVSTQFESGRHLNRISMIDEPIEYPSS